MPNLALDLGKQAASFGVTMVKPEDDVAGLLQRADMLLYRSKAGGRNRVTFETSRQARC